MEVIRYQVWYTPNDHSDLFDEFEDAYAEASCNGGIEIEELVWNDEEDYQNYSFADGFRTVWTKEN